MGNTALKICVPHWKCPAVDIMRGENGYDEKRETNGLLTWLQNASINSAVHMIFGGFSF